MNNETEQLFIVNATHSQPSASTQKLVGEEIAVTADSEYKIFLQPFFEDFMIILYVLFGK